MLARLLWWFATKMRLSVSPKTADRRHGSPPVPPPEEFVARPTLSPIEGSYELSVTVSIVSHAGSTTYYTLDGSDPTAASTLYTVPFALAYSPGAGSGADEYPIPLMDSIVGLYGGGSDIPTGSYLTRGIAAGATVSALSVPNRVVASLGMSTTMHIFQKWMDLESNAFCTRVNTANSGMTYEDWDTSSAAGWTAASSDLSAVGLVPADIRVAWVMLVTGSAANPNVVTVAQFETLLALLRTKWPNVKQLLISTYPYGGYHTILGSALDPQLWQAGVYARTFIQNHMDDTTPPWIGWGPYLWAYGTTARSDGLTWLSTDYSAGDGIHLSDPAGRTKASDLMEAFLQASAVTGWYRA